VLAHVLSKLQVMREQKNIFYETLHTIHRHYPPIVDTFMNRILHNYPQQIAGYKTQSLDMICNRLEVVEEKWRETSMLGLERLIVTRDEVEQILAIKIVIKMLQELTPRQALPFITKVNEVLQDSTAATRDKAFDLLMQVFIRFKLSTEGTEDKLKKLATSGLVSGLSDQDPVLQKKVLTFWRANAVDSTKPLPERFIDWMKILFVNDSANLFVGSYMQLLLEELVTSPDYNRKVFEHALGNCEFQDMPLLASWRTQHATMQPLFVQSQASQIVSQTLSSGGTLGAGYLKATQQSLLFEPTLEVEACKYFCPISFKFKIKLI
jgi:DNA-PKcs, CC5